MILDLSFCYLQLEMEEFKKPIFAELDELRQEKIQLEKVYILKYCAAKVILASTICLNLI